MEWSARRGCAGPSTLLAVADTSGRREEGKELQRCVGHRVAASGNDKREGLGSATAMKSVGRSTTARGERRSLEWERSTEKATMDPPEAGEVRSGTAGAARSWGEEARATAQKKRREGGGRQVGREE